MITKEEVGLKIRTIRTQKGLSQDELGKALNKSHAAVSDIERGKTDLSVTDLHKIADYLNISVTEFLMGNETPPAGSFVQARDAKNITPEEKKVADRFTEQFINLAREFANKKDSENK